MNDFIKASPLKRIGAAFIDLGLTYIVCYLLLSSLVMPITYSTTPYIEDTYKAYESLVDLGVVVIGQTAVEIDNGYVITIYADYESSEAERAEALNKVKTENSEYNYCYLTDEKLQITSEELDRYLTHFYNEIGESDKYLKQKNDNNSLFTNGEINPSAKEDEVKSFLTTIASSWMEEQSIGSYKDGEVARQITKVGVYGFVTNAIAMALSLIIFYFVIPVISKRRMTLGKRMMALTIVDIKTMEIASRPRVFLRSLFFVLVGLVPSFYVMGLPLVLFIIIMLLNNKGRTVEDFVTSTMVVDMQYFDFSKDVQSVEEQETGLETQERDVVSTIDDKA